MSSQQTKAPRRRARASKAAPITSQHDDIERHLADGTAILIGAGGEILAHRPSLPDVFLDNAPLVGRTISSLAPQGLAERVTRLWEQCARSGEASSGRYLVSLGKPGPDGVVDLGFRIACRREREGLWGLTIRDLQGERSRTLSLLEQIRSLEAQRDEWRHLARTSAHDIRSSLGAVTGFIKLALRKGPRTATHIPENLERALEATSRVRSIAERVLEAEARATTPSPPAHLGTLFQRLFVALEAAYPEVPFTWGADASDLRAAVPSDTLWGVLWNLFSNAVQYRSPARPLHIEVSIWSENSQICLEIRDNGRGIPRGEEEQIFAEGFRGSNANRTEGTGLGLSSARRLLTHWSGQIWAEPSDPGTRFRLVLPAG